MNDLLDRIVKILEYDLKDDEKFVFQRDAKEIIEMIKEYIEMNKIELLGRLTKDPEVRYTQTTNTTVANFTIAVSRRFAKEGDVQADFFNVVAWNKTGEFVSKYFKKGQQVAVVGRLQNRSWDDQNGQKHYATDIIAEEVYFADSKKEEGKVAEKEGVMYNTANGDDLPF